MTTDDPQVLDGTITIGQDRSESSYVMPILTFAELADADRHAADIVKGLDASARQLLEILQGVVFIAAMIALGYAAMYGIATIGMP